MKTNATLITSLTTSVLALGGLSLPAAGAPAQKPNIIFILADDLGIGNVSCYGADNFKTPNIDALAKSGIRFEHCYACPLCGPSRALLMTGRYAYHTGMTGNDSGPLLKPANETMMPKVLKPAGYVTAMCGKWSQLPLQPSDWGFDEYLRFQGSGKYWNTQAGNKAYTVNGKATPLLDGEYLPDTMHKFVVDFITRHKDQPFYVYYAMSHVHSEILRTPDSTPDSKDLYYDNVAYMDKLVGKLVAELDRLKLRENTLIVFAGDNGTVGKETPRSTVRGKVLSGSKGTMLECGALVPCIANWPGKTPAGKVTQSFIDLSDFLPTFAEVAGAKLPAGLTIDGKGFAPQLHGQSDGWPRSWIFVELGRHWYDRDAGWKLNEASELFDMKNAPYAEPLVATNTQDQAAITARKRLQAILDQLNPAGGIVDAGDGSGRHASNAKRDARKAARQKAGPNSGNANPDDE
jgi:arylsulfatase A